MAELQTINIGNQVNDGLGDDLRTAFEKVNANFADLNLELTITGLNVGETGVGVFKQKTNSTLEFKNLVGGRLTSLDEQENSIIINSDSPWAIESITTQGGPVIQAQSDNATRNITIQGGDDIDITNVGSVITANTVLPVTNILTYYDFGFINANYTNTIQLAMQSANIDFGTLVYVSSLDLDCGPLLT
jgi:hypothetical protein